MPALPSPEVRLVDLGGIMASAYPSAGKVVCKFVMITASSELNLVFGPVRRYPYHAHLVDAYCRLFNIPAAWIKQPDLVEIYGADHAVRGGGWMDLDPGGRSVKVYGQSTAYGQYEASDVRSVLSDSQVFPGYTVQIGA